MSDQADTASAADGLVCRSCGTQLPFAARFCSSCGLPVRAVSDDPVAFVDGDPKVGAERNSQPDGAAETVGHAHRPGSPQWLAVVGGLCVVLLAWLLFRSPPTGDESAGGDAAGSDAADTELVDDSSLPPEPDDTAIVGRTVDEDGGSNVAPVPDQDDEDSVDSGEILEQVPEPSSAVPTAPVDLGPADVDDLDADGWTIVIGDGHHVEIVDLGSGERRRYDNIGAPVATVGDRLLLYQPPELLAVPVSDPGGQPDLLARVPTLQEMYTRARSVKNPVLADNGQAIWWPNNNSNPQTWIKIDLVSGDVLDEMSLSSSVFGGPEIVSTLGSGTFERVDGQWELLGDLFASSASADGVLGQRCDSPDSCRWVLVDRRTGRSRTLDIEVASPLDATLITNADQPLILLSDRILDLDADRSIPLVLANPLEVVATNKADLLAVAHGVPSGVTRSSVTIYNLETETEARIDLSAMGPDWLVLARR